jgi:hypothetical protein
MTNVDRNRFALFLLPLLTVITVAIFSQLMKVPINDQSAIKVKSNPQPSSFFPLLSTQKNVLFKESAVSKGVIFNHEHRSSTLSGLADTYGSGVCTLDFNNDGFEDLFIVNGNGVTRRYGKPHWWAKNQGSRLYQNINGLFFKDVTEKMYGNNSISTKHSGYGCAVDDINNDGYVDIVLGNTNYIELLINNAGNSFTQESISLKTSSSAATENVWPMSITLWDWDQDGYQDILVANFTKFENDIKVGTTEYGYKSQTQFDPANFSGQQNILLTRNVDLQPKNISKNKTNNKTNNKSLLEFDVSYLDKFDRTLSIIPLQLLAPLQDNPPLNSVFIANATGSNSTVHSFFERNKTNSSSFNSMIRKIKSPVVQVSHLTIQDEPAVIFTQHKKGGVQLYYANQKEQDDIAWHVGLNSEKDNASQTWASLIADLNNDGLDDFISARGFASPHIDNLFKPQGSKNNIKIQSTSGKFSDNKALLMPQLSRSSRGAAFADFNNDGLIDIAFNNNNGFFSLYMNDSPMNNWVSFRCEPLHLCRNSHWNITSIQKKHLASKRFSQPEPFLSANQKRVHFGLGDFTKPIDLHVTLNDETFLTFSNISVNAVYNVNIKRGEIAPLKTNTIKKDKLNLPSGALLAYLLNANIDSLLSAINQNLNLNEEQLIQLSQRLISYKLNGKNISATNSVEYLTLTSWLLNQALRNNASNSVLLNNTLRLIGGSESSLYIDHLVELIATLPEENFCRLTDELHYWFWEEEVLPKSKQLLKSPLLYRLLHSTSTNIIICGLNALATTKDSTIGHSLIPLLHKKFSTNQQLKRVQAATIRTLGYLKHSTAKSSIIALCKNAQDAIINAECAITLYKFGLKKAVISDITPNVMHDKLIYQLHEDKIILDLLINPNDIKPSTAKASLKAYDDYRYSPQKVHFQLAHLIQLLSAKKDVERKKAFKDLVSLRKEKEIKDIISHWSQIAPLSIDKYIDTLDATNKMWLIPYASSHKMTQLILTGKETNHDFTYNYALAQQCLIRNSVKKVCDEQLKVNITMSTTDIESLLHNSPLNLMYSLLSDNNTVKKVTALRLFDLSKKLIARATTNKKHLTTLFSMLMINESYTLIRKNQIDKAWLALFIHSVYVDNLTLKQSWLIKLESLIDDQTRPIYQLIQQE